MKLSKPVIEYHLCLCHCSDKQLLALASLTDTVRPSQRIQLRSLMLVSAGPMQEQQSMDVLGLAMGTMAVSSILVDPKDPEDN